MSLLFTGARTRVRRTVVLACVVMSGALSLLAVGLIAAPAANAQTWGALVTCRDVWLRNSPGGYADRVLVYNDGFLITQAPATSGYYFGWNAREGYGWVLASCLSVNP